MLSQRRVAEGVKIGISRHFMDLRLLTGIGLAVDLDRGGFHAKYPRLQALSPKITQFLA